MFYVGIGVGIGRQRFGGGGVPPSFATTQWQLITQQWQTITTTWN
jgi:hypothetical protein